MRLLRAALFLAACALGVVPASAESAGECKVVRMKGAGFLKHCGDRLQLWHLKSSDERWRSGLDLHGRFSFECFILPSKPQPGLTMYDILRSQAATGDTPRCPEQPHIGGFFFNPVEWQKSSKDEHAIQATLFEMPLVSLVWSNDELKQSIRPTCPAFDVAVGDVNARATCFELPEPKQNIIAMVVVDGGTSLVLTFLQDNLAADALKSSFLDFAQLLTIERASGDAALLRWMQ